MLERFGMNCFRSGFVRSADVDEPPASHAPPRVVDPPAPSTARLVASLAGFLAVGAPLAMIAWHELSEVLSGRIVPIRMMEGFAALAALGATAFILARSMKGADA